MGMAKKRKGNTGQKPHGHYCKVCGEHKANEKFSGGGHTAHICKSCAAKSPEQRNEDMALRKIEGMAFRYLSEAELKWLRGKMNDARPAVREAARETHGARFPRYERNRMKKGLTACSLALYIHGEIWDEYGDEFFVCSSVILEDTGELRYVAHDAPDGEKETSIAIDKQDARRLLKAVIHELDALFWDEDLSDSGPDDEDYDPFVENDGEDVEEETQAAEPETPTETRPVLWSLRLELNNGEEKVVTFYEQMHDEPQELYWLLMEWFESEEDYEDEEENGTGE
jgi:hypothetical protein